MSKNLSEEKAEDTSENNDLTLLDAFIMLSGAQSKVLSLMMEGKTNSEIATLLRISKKTVANHITEIGKKLNLQGCGKVRGWLKHIMKQNGANS